MARISYLIRSPYARPLAPHHPGDVQRAAGHLPPSARLDLVLRGLADNSVLDSYRGRPQAEHPGLYRAFSASRPAVHRVTDPNATAQRDGFLQGGAAGPIPDAAFGAAARPTAFSRAGDRSPSPRRARRVPSRRPGRPVRRRRGSRLPAHRDQPVRSRRPRRDEPGALRVRRRRGRHCGRRGRHGHRRSRDLRRLVRRPRPGRRPRPSRLEPVRSAAYTADVNGLVRDLRALDGQAQQAATQASEATAATR